jgi:hypothetical protein
MIKNEFGSVPTDDTASQRVPDYENGIALAHMTNVLLGIYHFIIVYSFYKNLCEERMTVRSMDRRHEMDLMEAPLQLPPIGLIVSKRLRQVLDLDSGNVSDASTMDTSV